MTQGEGEKEKRISQKKKKRRENETENCFPSHTPIVPGREKKGGKKKKKTYVQQYTLRTARNNRHRGKRKEERS